MLSVSLEKRSSVIEKSELSNISIDGVNKIKSYSDNRIVAASQFVYDTFLENYISLSGVSEDYKPNTFIKWTIGPVADFLRYPILYASTIATSPIVFLAGLAFVDLEK